MSTFLPANYEIPKKPDNYFKPSKMENNQVIKIRIFSQALLGYIYWTNESRPVRSKEVPKETPNIQKDGSANHCWNVIIWNYETARFEIWEITQKTIMMQIRNFAIDTDYGSPFQYDIKVKKSLNNDKAEYSILPSPAKIFDDKLTTDIDLEFFSKIDLEKLFTSEDPFNN